MTSPQRHAPDTSHANGDPERATADVGDGEEQNTTTTTAPHQASNGSDDISTQDTAKTSEQSSKGKPLWHRIYTTLFWVPPQARFDPASPPAFSMALNILFAFAGAFTVANLYYNHPILNILAADFDVPYETVAQIPTLAQAGYAVGLFFLCPLGDLFKRRPFVLSLVFFTATMRWVRFFAEAVWRGCAYVWVLVLDFASRSR